MKYQRGKRYVTTSETFIERLASSSSLTKKPYYIECTGSEPVRSRDWLLQRLHEFRKPEAKPSATSRQPTSGDSM